EGARCMYVYSSAGKYVRTLGSRGRGPSEFAWIRDVSVLAGDTIHAYDASLRAVKVFHPDTGFIRAGPISQPDGALGAAQVTWLDRDRHVHLTSRPSDLES